tara:strand:+ start:4100 stop:5287 length:1188 start_codon:yes stop_codon:yes gene_type:complete
MNIIEVNNLSKKYSRSLKHSLKYGFQDSIKDIFGGLKESKDLRPHEFWAIENISFNLKKGESLGLIGSNGSGKTTLLKVLNSLVKPTYGSFKLNGTVGALIALGTGFNPILTGRENVKIAASVLGFTPKEAENMLEEIIDFSEINEFIDSPVRTYSSGMLVRLGFSVAIQMKPEILFVDEVLAVGDLAFALKCQRKITEYRNNGGSLILVSHGLHNVRFHCDKTIWLNKSKIVMEGNSNLVCTEYELAMQEGLSSTNAPLVTDDSFKMIEARIKETIKSDEVANFEFIFKAERELQSPVVEVAIFDQTGNPVIQRFNDNDSYFFEIKPGLNKINLSFDSLRLKSGTYHVTFIVNDQNVNNPVIYCHNSYRFNIKNEGAEFGLMINKPIWSVSNES